MTNPKQLYQDVRKFHQRLKTYLKKKNLPYDFEYISATECQARGSSHQHNLYIFKTKASFIKNDELAKIWGLGYTKTKSLKGVSNIGLYLTAYLTDLDLTEDKNKGITKAVIKGKRLSLIPKNFRIYRCSKNILKPTIYKTTEKEAMEKVDDSILTYEKTIRISNCDGKTINIINYRNYNNIKNTK
jgi:hypothetical protein